MLFYFGTKKSLKGKISNQSSAIKTSNFHFGGTFADIDLLFCSMKNTVKPTICILKSKKNSVKGVQDKSTWDIFHKMNNDLMTLCQSMDLSRRDAFRPCSRDSSGDKGQFCFISQNKKKLIGIGPLYRFWAICLPVQYGYSKTYLLWLLQNQCNMATPKHNILKSMLFYLSIITLSILFVNYQFYWGQKI